jgi:hypothetical protein
MICTAAQLRALSQILAPYRGEPLNRVVVDLALQLARLEPVQ